MQKLTHLHIRNAKDDETSIESATQIFASILSAPYVSLFKRLFKTPPVFSFEIFLVNKAIHFYVTAPSEHAQYMTSLIGSSYPVSFIITTDDPLEQITSSKNIAIGDMKLAAPYYLPIKTYADFSIDPLTSLIGFMAKQSEDITMAVQIIVTPASFGWQSNILRQTTGVKKGGTGEEGPSIEYALPKAQMTKKASFQGGKAVIRLAVGSNNLPPTPFLHDLAGTFGSFSLGDGNQLILKKPLIRKAAFLSRIKHRNTPLFERRYQIFNSQELATLWHPPGLLLAGIKNISWGKTLKGEPPENLPTAFNLTDEEKQKVNFFAQADFKNSETIFGIKDADRRKHVYIMGKTGAGKSTLIANMAIDDIRKGRGIGIIDPHGDLSETILDYIPKRRLNDVVYLEPFDTQRPFSLNVLEIKNTQHKDLVASGIVSIFSKIYADSWGPRLEYILRNVIFTLLEIPGSTLIDALRILSEPGYRKSVIPGIKDVVIRNFWENEFEKMADRLRSEAVSPIQNKVGQFVSSKMIRNIIGQPKSSINLEEIMNNKKILILNLSQGKLGEDNASLLGAMIITQIQLAAMNRAFMKEEDRQDFFLYVDEFQNFATSSFIKILSEARKYRLAITLANQYIGQLELEVQQSIFGNAGTLISFVTGATDAEHLQKEFAGLYTQNDLVSLGKFETVMKLSIDGMTSMPFPAKTLPLPNLKNDNRETVIRLSKERYGRNPSH